MREIKEYPGITGHRLLIDRILNLPGGKESLDSILNAGTPVTTEILWKIVDFLED